MLYLEHLIPGLLPGIEQFIIASQNRDEGWRVRLTRKGSDNSVELGLNSGPAEQRLIALAGESPGARWLNQQQLPFAVEKGATSLKHNLFDELQHIIMLVNLPGRDDEIAHLIFLFFRADLSSFGISGHNRPLTTDHKTMLSFTYEQMFRTIVRQWYEDREALRQWNGKTTKLISRTQEMKQSWRQMEENYGMSLVQLCRHWLKALAEKTGCTARLSDDAISWIKQYRGDFSALEVVIRDAFEYAWYLSAGLEKDLVINEWHLDLPDRKASPEQQVPESRDEKFARTIQLLDRLESAAQRLKQKNEKLTGSRVGAAMQEPVSAPAITDALSKHSGRIKKLVERYPHRWTLIISEFRPLRNVLSG
ncbi:MAG: hypothetical protein Kow00127_08500 [Bacteroidales bacterium]